MNENIIIIATQNVEKALYIIAKEATLCDEIEIQYTERYAPTVEYLLRTLRKGFGWLEKDRGETTTINNKCKHNINGQCAFIKNLNELSISNLKCAESVRSNCKHYSPRYTQPMEISYIIIYKAGGIRGL